MTNTVIYARFSSVGQNEQTIDGQIRVCREYAEREGLSVIGIYDKDKAKSASKETEKRKDLHRMFADAETGAFQYIIVYKMDRFARNRNESRIFKSELAKHGVRVLSATENITDDPFGHSGGLPQILVKNGYTGYLICRPKEPNSHIPSTFRWIGRDGSEVNVCRIPEGYAVEPGKLAARLKEKKGSDRDSVILWGLGNHGGGPSRADLEAVLRFHDEEIAPVHACPEDYFETLGILPEVRGELNPVFPGCYTSLHTVKALHRALENLLFRTEKLLAEAHMAGVVDYPERALEQAQRSLLLCQFHDLLPGSCSEEVCLETEKTLSFGLEILAGEERKAMFRLANGFAPAAPGEYPVFLFNPHPYSIRGTFVCEMCLAQQNWSGSYRVMDGFDANGSPIVCQLLKETPNIEVDWMKRVAFSAELPPASVSRFSFFERKLEQKPRRRFPSGRNVEFDNGFYHAKIDASGGLLESLRVGKTEYLKHGAFSIEVRSDTPDSWGFFDTDNPGFRDRTGLFSLLSEEESGAFSGLNRPFPAVRVVEDGPLFTDVECVFGYGNSRARAVYRFYREQNYFDFSLDLYFGERDRILKLCIPTTLTAGFRGQSAFSTEVFPTDGSERVAQKWIAADGEDRTLAILNDCVYGFSAREGQLEISLVRGAAYSAMPIDDFPMVRQDGFSPRMDQGLHRYRFRVCFGESGAVNETLDRNSVLFNEPCMALNYFPDRIERNLCMHKIVLAPGSVTMHSLRAVGDRFVMRLHNNSPESRSERLTFGDQRLDLNFSPFEIKTIERKGGQCFETFGQRGGEDESEIRL